MYDYCDESVLKVVEYVNYIGCSSFVVYILVPYMMGLSVVGPVAGGWFAYL